MVPGYSRDRGIEKEAVEYSETVDNALRNIAFLMFRTPPYLVENIQLYSLKNEKDGYEPEVAKCQLEIAMFAVCYVVHVSSSGVTKALKLRHPGGLTAHVDEVDEDEEAVTGKVESDTFKCHFESFPQRSVLFFENDTSES